MERPSAITPVTIAMCVTNLLGLFLVNWKPYPHHHPGTLFTYFAVLILVGYVVLWKFWLGRNWARWLVILTSICALWNLWQLRKPIPPQFDSAVRAPMVLAEGVIALFLLVYLNLGGVRAWYIKRPYPDS
jgi:hypothetical protein